ncbi:MAG: penicillin-binding protein activator [Hyphomicrobiales bacterium]|nr:penicillin-binding protein activator [Hyphomicrobiales bacterium]
MTTMIHSWRLLLRPWSFLCFLIAAAMLTGCSSSGTGTKSQASEGADGTSGAPGLETMTLPSLGLDPFGYEIPPEAAEIRGAPPPAAPASERTRAAILLPLSGPLSSLGQAMFNAATIALFDLDASRLELLPYDTKGTPEGAEEAARLALLEGAALILGPLLSGSVQAVAPVAAMRQAPVLAFSSDQRVARDGVHIMGFTPQAEVQRIIGFAAASGYRRIAVLGPNDGYGAAVVAAANASAAGAGADVSFLELYDPETIDFSAVAERLFGPGARPLGVPDGEESLPAAQTDAAIEAARRFDAVLVADSGPRLKSVVAYLSAAGLEAMRVRLLGTGAWDENDIVTDPDFQGAWFAAPPPALRQSFERRYQGAYGKRPPRLATLAYDATAVASVVAQERGSGIGIEQIITDPNGFLGRDGLFRFPPSGLTERRLAVLEVETDGVRVISQPVFSFLGS